MKKNTIVIVATKNRTGFLEKVIFSISKQTIKPFLTIIVSDSTKENKIHEKSILSNYDYIFLEDKYTHNYAGSLNTALDYVVNEVFIKKTVPIKNLFIAFLDDDDYWKEKYLEECISIIDNDTDFVVTGLEYETDNKKFLLDIPNNLTLASFLAKNPHIQGSNTFIRFTTLLKAGCFDENMSSTTDRDLFTRVLMLNPKYKIINKWLVYINAKTDRKRLTTTAKNKKDSLSKFFAKYGGLMNQKIEKTFFEKINRHSPLSKKKITQYLSYDFNSETNEINNHSFDKRIVFSFIAGHSSMAHRLIIEIGKQLYKNIKIVMIMNYDGRKKEINKYFKQNNIKDYIVYSVDEIKNLINEMPIKDFLKESHIKESINDIATARTILNYLIDKNINDDDVVWIIDDDMQFAKINRIDGKFISQDINIKDICGKFINVADAVIGSYSLEPPLPLFFSLRTKLLDYTYSKKLNKNNLYDNRIYNQQDYYYDLTEKSNKHLETPLKCENIELDSIFGGLSTSRPLFECSNKTFKPYCRGGNTIIFNRRLLQIPNISIIFGKTISRRGDYFWTKQAINSGFKIIASSFSLLHNRPTTSFDYEHERDKSIKDMLGSSFTKSFKNFKESRTFFSKKFINELDKRLIRFIISYYRIIGLLNILETDNRGFTEDNILDYVRIIKQYKKEFLIEAAYNSLINNYNKSIKSSSVPSMKEKIEKVIGKKLRFLGNGQEGAVLTDEIYVYKAFFEHFNHKYLLKLNTIADQCELFEHLDFIETDELFIIKYKFYADYKKYLGGYSKSIAEAFSLLKKYGLVLTNIKRNNFIVANKKIKFIDYGKNIESITKEKYNFLVERAYEMIKYPKLTISEFDELISLSHKGLAQNICYGIENFKLLIDNRTKEQIHDPMLLKEINYLSPYSIFDYGAGKCKIINSLVNKYIIDAFDIDQHTIFERADKFVGIIKDIEKNKKKYDLVLSNLVLCCVDDKTTKDIVNKIYNLLNTNGFALISFCNPFFTDIKKTELKNTGRDKNYMINHKWKKETIYGTRIEYHRPLSFYYNLFNRNGFEIEKVSMDDGVDLSNLEPVSEHIMFRLKKKTQKMLFDCSLLIKCNPMDYKNIIEDIEHIVLSLEKNCCFKEKVVIVDCYNAKNRNRIYSNENKDALLSSLKILLNNNLIDRIVTFDVHNDKTYNKWFGATVGNPYSTNGQQLEASLYSFDTIKTRYVFQTDVDIIYSNNDSQFAQKYNEFIAKNAITGCLSIFHKKSSNEEIGCRTEVRNCFLDLKKIQNILPLKNTIEKERFKLPWHRALDLSIKAKESIRFKDSKIMFIHPSNEQKKINNLVYPIKYLITEGYGHFKNQNDNIELQGILKDWVKQSFDNMILFIRGKNTSCEKLLRLFNSIKNQTYSLFSIIYIDDNSNKQIADYAKMIIKYDDYFKDKTIGIFNSDSINSLANFEFAMKHIAKNPESIIVNIDSDDAFLRNDALEIIKKEFEKGVDLTVGNCLRSDKPLKNYNVESFDELWKRDGDNVWLHPKCFRRYLVNYCFPFLKNNEEKYFNVATDYAIMLPIIKHAKKPVFIPKQIYYFDPSFMNKTKSNQYNIEHKKEIMDFLLKQNKEYCLKKTVSVVGDTNPTKENYDLAEKIGKTLVDLGYKVQTGGLGGIMEAALKGARKSKRYNFGDTIGIIPSLEENEANEYADIVIPTRKDICRNYDVVDTNAVIVIGGGAGTLSEIAFAWQMHKLIIAFEKTKGWAKKLADKSLDTRVRYKKISDDRIYSAQSIEEMVNILEKYISLYTRKYRGIKWRKNK